MAAAILSGVKDPLTEQDDDDDANSKYLTADDEGADPEESGDGWFSQAFDHPGAEERTDSSQGNATDLPEDCRKAGMTVTPGLDPMTEGNAQAAPRATCSGLCNSLCSLFREQCRHLLGWWPFNVFMLSNVLLSILILVFENKKHSGLSQHYAFRKFDDICTIYFLCIFTLEAALKIAANGLLFSVDNPVTGKIAPGDQANGDVSPEKLGSAGCCKSWESWGKVQSPYLRCRWNIIGLIVLLLSYYDLGVCGANTAQKLSCVSSRFGRAARPFRLLLYSDGMKQVVNSFFYAIPNLIGVVFVSNAIYFCFAIVAVNMFGHLFR